MGVFSFIIAYKKKLQLQQIKNRIKQRADGDEEEEEEEEGEEEEKEKGKQKGWVTKRELKEVIEGMKGWYWGCLGVLTSFFIFRANYLAEGSLQVFIDFFFFVICNNFSPFSFSHFNRISFPSKISLSPNLLLLLRFSLTPFPPRKIESEMVKFQPPPMTILKGSSFPHSFFSLSLVPL